MSDVSLICPRCGLETVASEFASEDGRVCKHCGSPLPIDRSAFRKAPGMALREKPEAMPEAVGPGAAALRRIPTDQTRAARQKRSVRQLRASRIRGLLVLLGVGGGSLAAQWLGQDDAGVREFYLTARYVVVVMAVVLVLYEAFFESSIQGVLCIVIPFYIAYFALFHVESRVRRWCFISLMVLLAGECWFMPNTSIVSSVERSVNKGIDRVTGLIQRAGEPML